MLLRTLFQPRKWPWPMGRYKAVDCFRKMIYFRWLTGFWIRPWAPVQNLIKRHYPAGIYLFKVNNRNTRTRCEICSKLTSCSTKTFYCPCYWLATGICAMGFSGFLHNDLLVMIEFRMKQGMVLVNILSKSCFRKEIHFQSQQ